MVEQKRESCSFFTMLIALLFHITLLICMILFFVIPFLNETMQTKIMWIAIPGMFISETGMYFTRECFRSVSYSCEKEDRRRWAWIFRV